MYLKLNLYQKIIVFGNINVYVWPHVSAQTNTLTSIDQIVNAARCITDGLEALNQINEAMGINVFL